MVRNMPKSQLRDIQWLTPAEAAAALGVTTKTVSRLADRGEIHTIRPGGTQRRYAAADVEAILAREPWDAP